MADSKVNEKERWVDSLLGRMTLEQKVGQLMVTGFYGPFITPDIVELIGKYHVGGLRITQKFHGGTGDHRTGIHLPHYLLRSSRDPGPKTYDRPADLRRMSCTPVEYAETLNRLRDYALDRKDGIGLHMTFDQEGEGADLFFGQRLFPHPMGLRASNSPELAYKVAVGIGRQARALGGNMIHSPVLDVNTNPENPEIGPRAYGENPDDVTKYALESLRGFQETGITATAKHFPGRGASDKDAHYGLPVIDLDRETLMTEHLAPYKALIDAGLPAVMAAFTAYPGLGGGDVPAATSREIVTGILRDEFGFEGVVTSDAIQMGGLLEKFEIGEAVIRCLVAGCDLFLSRAVTPVNEYILGKVLDAVKSGRYPESQMDESVARILRMRWDMGLADNGGKVDASKAGDIFYDQSIIDTTVEAAEKSTLLLRDDANLLPLDPDQSVLLIEQIHHFHSFINTPYSHPGLLWEEMCKLSDNVSIVLIREKYRKEDEKAVFRRLDKADVIVSTSYYNYRTGAIMIPLLNKIRRKTDKPIILVSNSPYEKFGVPEDFPTAIVSFCPSGRENIRVVAQALFGKVELTAELPSRVTADTSQVAGEE